MQHKGWWWCVEWLSVPVSLFCLMWRLFRIYYSMFKVEMDCTQLTNYMQEEIAVSGFVLWFVCWFLVFLFPLPLNAEEFKNTLTQPK